jgi:hypothetical protein
MCKILDVGPTSTMIRQQISLYKSFKSFLFGRNSCQYICIVYVNKNRASNKLLTSPMLHKYIVLSKGDGCTKPKELNASSKGQLFCFMFYILTSLRSLPDRSASDLSNCKATSRLLPLVLKDPDMQSLMQHFFVRAPVHCKVSHQR